MGEAYIGLADDPSALYWNPAGLGQLSNYHIHLSHHQWFAGIKDELLHTAFPIGPGALELGMVYTGEPDIEYWTGNNQPIGTFRTWDGILNLGYGATIARDYHLGFGFKGFYQNLHTAEGYGGALDLGFLARPLPFLGLGAVARNLGIARYGSAMEDLPSSIGVGANLTMSRFRITADAFYPFADDIDIRAGLEYAPWQSVALRLGYRLGPADLATLGYLNGITAGLGVSLGNFGLDYCITPYGKLGIAHRIGLRARITRKGHGILEIRVINAGTMEPLWAAVAFSGIQNHATRTNRRGEMKLLRLVPGQLVIRTSIEEHLPRIDTLLILGDRTQYATIALKQLEYGSAWGVLRDAVTGSPVGGTIAYQGPVYGEQAVPENTGSFVLENLPTGRYVLTATGPTPEYMPQACTLDIRASKVAEYDFRLLKRQ